MSSGDGRDLEDFRRFLTWGIFRLGLYKTFDENKPVYCVCLLVKCEEPHGWIAVWRRCYGNLEKAKELLESIEPLARNSFGELLYVVEIRL